MSQGSDGRQEVRGLGRGRLGEAILFREDGTGREVVVKRLDLRLDEHRARLSLQTELLAAGAAATHSCAVPIEDVWVDDATGTACVLSQFCSGGTAQQLLTAARAVAADDIVILGIRLAAALAHSHRNGVLHLDVRPSNVLRDADGNWKLGDSGLAAAVHRVAPGQVSADPRYAPRELQGWESPGPAADVYGLGATMYAMLIGADPPPAEAAMAIVAHGPVPGAPPALTGLIARMCAADPETRPPLTEVDRALRGLLPAAASIAVPAPAAAPPAQALPTPRLPESMRGDVEVQLGTDPRTRRIWIGSGVGVAVLALGATAFIVAGGSDEESAPTAQSDAPSAAAAAPAPAAANPGAVADAASTGRDVPPAERAQYLAQNVKVIKAGRQIQVTWRPPQSPTAVTGYVVVAQTPSGIPQGGPKNAAAGEQQVVFAIPPATPESCFVVTTFINTPDGIKLAKGPKTCLKGGK